MVGHKTMGQPGQERVKADYLVLRTIAANDGEIAFDDLKEAVDNVVGALRVESPICFTPTSGPVTLQSRSFNEAIHRCQDSRFIERDDRRITITNEGEAFISNGKYKNTDSVQNFKSRVDEAVQRLFDS